VNLRTAPRR